MRPSFPLKSIAWAAGCLFAGSASWAQQAAPAPAAAASAPAAAASAPKPTAAAPSAAATSETITVTGVRGSVASAINRKRNGATVTDVIVAEDINQFPDKTIGDAMSRITGVQLGRDGDSGEGSSVAIRGMDPSWTRVEINGMSQLGASLNNASNAGDLREISAEMVKSIEVVKGVLPNVREGGIGGTVIIETRKPLDFKERFVALSAAAQYVSNSKATTPRLTFIATDKFLDNKLGVMLNVTYDDVNVRGDAATTGGSASASSTGNFNLQRDWDFGADKTYTSSNAQSAAVTTKAGCSSLVSTNTAVITTANLIADCTKQWNDFAPSVLRYNIRERNAKRTSGDLTLQYQFDDTLRGYLTVQPNEQAFRYRNFDYGFTLVADDLGSSMAAMYDRFRSSTGGTAPVYNADGSVKTAGTCGAAPTAATNIPVTLNAANLVTGFTLGNCLNVANQGGNNLLSSATREQKINIKSLYSQVGFNFRNDTWKIDGFVGTSRQGYVEDNFQTGLGINVAGMTVQPTAENVPLMVLPAGFDWYNPNNYSSASLNYTASLQVRKESVAQLDFDRRLDLGWFNRLMFGANFAHQTSLKYSSNSTYTTPAGATITTMGSQAYSTLNFDSLNPYDSIPASQRAWTQNTLFQNRTTGTRSITRPEMAALLKSMLITTPGTFMGDGKVSSPYPGSWMAPTASGALASGLFDSPNTTGLMNSGRLMQALGNDGNLYPQTPDFDIQQNVAAGYLRLDWEKQLLSDLTVEGNFGARLTSTYVSSSGVKAIPITLSNGTVASLRQLVNVKHQYQDALPAFNLAFNTLGGKFITRLGYGKVLTRPNLDALRPNVTCVYDAADGVDNCSGGSPVLKPFRANKYDLSFEYYPNRQSQISLAFYRINITTDGPGSLNTYLGAIDVFGDGQLRDVYVPANQEPGPKTRGIEFAARTAFTFLPGALKYTGGDFNVTHNGFSYVPGTEQYINFAGSYNLLQPRAGMSTTTYNLGLWYDDGKLMGRLAYQYRSEFYRYTDRRSYPWFQNDQGFLDAKVQYRFDDKFSVALEGKNLLRQASSLYVLRPDLPRDYTWNGRRYYLTGTYKF